MFNTVTFNSQFSHNAADHLHQILLKIPEVCEELTFRTLKELEKGKHSSREKKLKEKLSNPLKHREGNKRNSTISRIVHSDDFTNVTLSRKIGTYIYKETNIKRCVQPCTMTDALYALMIVRSDKSNLQLEWKEL